MATPKVAKAPKANKPKTAKPSKEKKAFGGSQEGSGRKPKAGNVTTFKLSPRGREILELSKARQNQKQLAPTLEEILEEYAQIHNLPVTTPKEGEETRDE